jgi:endonuclease/exonuclease/phosphatase (EEP) superfamily protein YafD
MINYFFPQKSSWNPLWFFLFLGTFLGSIIPLAGLGTWSEWSISFLPALLFYGAIVLGILIWKKIRWYWLLLFLPQLIYYATLVLPYVFTAKAPLKEGEGMKVYVANILKVNRNFDKVVDQIKQEDPDLIFLQEVDQAWVNAMYEGLHETYPMRWKIPMDNNFGIMLLSKKPLKSHKTGYSSELKMPFYEFELEYEGKLVHFVGMHTYPPSSTAMFQLRNRQLRELESLARPNSIFMGDFNVSTYSPYFRRLLRGGKMQDPRRYSGFKHSWPTSFPLLQTNLDHILVGQGVQFGKLKRLGHVGSDHFPLILNIK